GYAAPGGRLMPICRSAIALLSSMLLVAVLGACAPAVPSAPPAAAPAKPEASAPTAVPAAQAPAPAPAAAAPQPATVRVGILNSIGDLAFSVGIEKGYYAEQ